MCPKSQAAITAMQTQKKSRLKLREYSAYGREGIATVVTADKGQAHEKFIVTASEDGFVTCIPSLYAPSRPDFSVESKIAPQIKGDFQKVMASSLQHFFFFASYYRLYFLINIVGKKAACQMPGRREHAPARVTVECGGQGREQGPAAE